MHLLNQNAACGRGSQGIEVPYLIYMLYCMHLKNQNAACGRGSQIVRGTLSYPHALLHAFIGPECCSLEGSQGFEWSLILFKCFSACRYKTKRLLAGGFHRALRGPLSHSHA